MADFSFMRDKDLRLVLERDYAELERARSHGGLAKACATLAGSIVEALLVDHLLASGLQQGMGKPVNELTLGQLVALCDEQGMLQAPTIALASAVNDHRTLLHPGKETRTGVRLDAETVEAAILLTHLVIRDVSEERTRNQGLTAEQFLEKLSKDSEAGSIMAHLVRALDPDEAVNLVAHALPARYMEIADGIDACMHESCTSDAEAEYMRSLGREAEALEDAHRTLVRSLGESVGKAFVTETARTIREEGKDRISTYLNLLQGSDLQWADSEDRQLLKDRVVSSLSPTPTDSQLHLLEGIGGFLDANETSTVMRLLLRAAYDRHCEGLGFWNGPTVTLLWLGPDLTPVASEQAMKVLQESLSLAESSGTQEYAEWITRVRDEFENPSVF